MDRIDIKILKALQRDASMSTAELAEEVGLSSTPCWRRVRNLEENGVIAKRVAVLDPKKVNVDVTVFVAIKAGRHAKDWLGALADAIDSIEEITEAYRLSGETDYMLKVVVPDIEAYDKVYKRLIAKVDLADVSSSFSMEEIKATTALPLDYVG